MGKFGEIDSADKRAEKFPLVSMGGWVECLYPFPVDEETPAAIWTWKRKEMMEMCVPWEWKTIQETGGSLWAGSIPLPPNNPPPPNENPMIQPNKLRT